MGNQALFPGSFDPFTRGHESVVRNALKLFDKIIVGIGVNSGKQYLFTPEQRRAYIQDVFSKDKGKVEVVIYEGLTVDFCKKNGLSFIIRGLRNTRDFEFEYEIASMNKVLNTGIETLFLPSQPEHSAVNSTIVREIYRNGGDVSQFIPAGFTLPV